MYIGESSRSLFERSKEHYDDAKHWLRDHSELDTQPQFKFRISGQFKDCLSRQVTEAIKIMFSKDELLNSKSEYLANNISRITIEEDVFDRKRKERFEEEVEKLEKEMLDKFRKVKKKPEDTSGVENPEKRANPEQAWKKVRKRRCIELETITNKRRKIAP